MTNIDDTLSQRGAHYGAFRRIKMTNIDDTLSQRGAHYGAFKGHARIAQTLKDTLRSEPGWTKLRPDMKEALDMTMHKIARILNGDPEFHASWHDIIDYVRLIEKTLTPMEGKQK